MAPIGRSGRPDEELFMQASSQSNTPAVEPLRISKSPAQSPATQAAAGRFQPPYPTGYSPPRNEPPQAPLPYPNMDSSPLPTHPPGSSRPHFPPNDPNRPSLSGYAQAPHPSQASNYASSQTSQSTVGDGRPKPLPESPGPETPDKDAIFNRIPQHLQYQDTDTATSASSSRPAPSQYQYPAPEPSYTAALRIPNPSGVNRLASTSSVSTTKAARGSPPPPETPADDYPPGAGIEARYAAAGIAGTSTLNSLQAQSLAAQQRRQQYPVPNPTFSPPPQIPATPPNTASQPGPPQSQQSDPRRRWTPTEPGFTSPTTSASSRPAQDTPLEQDLQQMQVSDEPPPAYSSVPGASSGRPTEKPGTADHRPRLSVQSTTLPSSSQGQSSIAETVQPQPMHPHAAAAAAAMNAQTNDPSLQAPQSAPSPAPSTASTLPPLPEGWIAHLDQNSGLYYYIHLPTQSTQWEFPKGPTPLNLNDQPPLSPTGTIVNNPFSSPTASTFGGKPLGSPGLIPDRQSIMTMASLSSPTAAGFTVPPPSAGVDMYRVAPTNGVYFGPYLRYTNMDVDNGTWYGSILLVTEGQSPPTIHIHQTTDLSPDPRQLKANHIYTHQRWLFYRYDIDLKMEEDRDAKWTYAVTSFLGCTRYEFLVAGRYETSWRFITHSGNDFALNVNANERQKLGGIGYMWKDILQKHVEVGGFHAQLGLGNQISADRLWKEIPSLKQWTATSGKEARQNAPWTTSHEEEVTHAYFHYYTSHFDQPHLREAFAQIPHVLTLDDHDIFDGFGSYPNYMQFSNMFKNIGRIGVEMYLLFQHHTTVSILRGITNDFDLFTITGAGWHFIKYLGPAVVAIGPDCRSERNPAQVMSGATYQGLFPKVAVLPPHVQHLLWLIPVPLVYPRLEAAEHFAQTMATGKKAVTGTFNAFGKVTSSVAGIVGAKGVVSDSFTSIKKAVGKSGLMSNVLSPFGEIDILDELRDQWTNESKDIERTYLIRTLQRIATDYSKRITIFSGAAGACGAGLLHDPASPNSSRTMYQIISSAVVNAPPSAYVLRMLHPGSTPGATPSRPLYVPQNGVKSRADGAPTDTKEDMLEIFGTDVNGQPRDLRRLMGRRNYCAVVSFDPEAVSEAFASQAGSVAGGEKTAYGNVSLAIDFFVQAEGGGFAAQAPGTVKYGPLTIPSVVPGR